MTDSQTTLQIFETIVSIATIVSAIGLITSIGSLFVIKFHHKKEMEKEERKMVEFKKKMKQRFEKIGRGEYP